MVQDFQRRCEAPVAYLASYRVPVEGKSYREYLIGGCPIGGIPGEINL